MTGNAWIAPLGTSPDDVEAWQPLGLVGFVGVDFPEDPEITTAEVSWPGLTSPHTVTASFTLTGPDWRRLRRLLFPDVRARRSAMHSAYRRRLLARRRRNRNH